MFFTHIFVRSASIYVELRLTWIQKITQRYVTNCLWPVQREV